MSVKDLNKAIIVSNALNGEILLSEIIYDGKYATNTIDKMIQDLINKYVWENEQGVLIKIGVRS